MLRRGAARPGASEGPAAQRPQHGGEGRGALPPWPGPGAGRGLPRHWREALCSRTRLLCLYSSKSEPGNPEP